MVMDSREDEDAYICVACDHVQNNSAVCTSYFYVDDVDGGKYIKESLR